MIKKLLVVSLAALGIGLTGCLTDPEESTGPTITLGAIDTLVANSGISKVAVGTITADDALVGDPSVEIVNSTGQVVLASVISRSLVVSEKKEKSEKISITLQALTGATTGNYTLKITAVAGASATTNFNFSVKGAIVPVGTPVDTMTLTAGANQNLTYGSSIDLDGGVAWMSATAAQNVAKIDLCYANTGTDVDKLGTPFWATESNFNFAKNWTNPPATKFYKTTLTAQEFDAIDTKEEMPTFNETLATAISYSVVVGDVFLVKTTENKIVLVKVSNKVTGDAGTLTIKFSK